MQNGICNPPPIIDDRPTFLLCLGNQQTYAWINTEGIDQLVTVTDSYGRSIEYRYYGEEADYRLREIEDFLGRKLNFQYDELGHLVAAVTPSVMQAAPGNEFPGDPPDQ